jgi:2-phospho-L-lactate guanylyltransferase
MSTTVVIPVKAFVIAKSRLSSILSLEQRQQLSKEMFLHVLKSSRCPLVRDQIVVTSDRHVIRLATEQGTIPILEEGNGLNNALAQATRHIAQRETPSILILPSDLPFIKPQDIENIFNLAKEERAVIISPCHRGSGTNALFVKPPGILEYAFGEQSFERHKLLAFQSGIIPKIYRSHNIEFDLDLPEDYHYYLGHKVSQ